MAETIKTVHWAHWRPQCLAVTYRPRWCDTSISIHTDMKLITNTSQYNKNLLHKNA